MFTQEHEDLRESLSAWVKKELYPHRNEWEETYWPSEVMSGPGTSGTSGSAFRRSTAGRAATTSIRWCAPSA